MAEEEWLTTIEAARRLKITTGRLLQLRKRGLIRDFYPLGRPEKGAGPQGRVMVRIAASEVERFIMREGRRPVDDEVSEE